MADDTTTPEAKPEAPPEDPKVPAGADNPDAVKNALNAERKAAKDAKRRAEAAEAKVREYEEANASELEKAQAKVAKAEQAKAEAEARLTRFEVASEKEVPPKLVPLLTATSREELEAQADLIIENAKTEPDPEFDGGARDPAPDPESPETAHDKLVTQLIGGLHN